jgi:hypothetical protein
MFGSPAGRDELAAAALAAERGVGETFERVVRGLPPTPEVGAFAVEDFTASIRG